MSTMTEIEEKPVSTWNDRLKLKVQVRGSGPPLVYLHPEAGLYWNDALVQLAERYTIYAPLFPGSKSADSFSIHALDDVFDVVLAYEAMLRSLGLVGVPVIGASFGGMLAAELASCFTGLFSKVILIGPAGLWNEEHVWTLDYMSATPVELPPLLFANPDAAGPKAMLAKPDDPDEALDRTVETIWALGCAAKFLWPIPDRGLSKRLHRIAVPTLIIWGENDRIIPATYAKEFSKRISGSSVAIIADCGHVPEVEQTAATLEAIMGFLG
jgi:pimeloyl-ACP methyl ester carboxylesterase